MALLDAWYHPETSPIPYIRDALAVFFASVVIAAVLYIIVESVTDFFEKK